MRSRVNSFIDRLNGLKSWQVALMFFIVALAVFATGLFGDWQNDDKYQITDNMLVQSLSNIPFFFQGGTMYQGGGFAPLTGNYYRPLMSTFFTFIYTFFGAEPFWFHFIQLLVAAGAAFILYLVLKRFMAQSVALGVGLIFLVHPVNSQSVFSIPCLQDPLYFFFGIFAVWLLTRSDSYKTMALAAGCLLLSLFSKETGIVFVAISLLYLLMFNVKRLLRFMAVITAPLALYLLMKLEAVSIGYVHAAPIDYFSLPVRLLNDPSILLLYISGLIPKTGTFPNLLVQIRNYGAL